MNGMGPCIAIDHVAVILYLAGGALGLGRGIAGLRATYAGASEDGRVRARALVAMSGALLAWGWGHPMPSPLRALVMLGATAAWMACLFLGIWLLRRLLEARLSTKGSRAAVLGRAVFDSGVLVVFDLLHLQGLLAVLVAPVVALVQLARAFAEGRQHGRLLVLHRVAAAAVWLVTSVAVVSVLIHDDQVVAEEEQRPELATGLLKVQAVGRGSSGPLTTSEHSWRY